MMCRQKALTEIGMPPHASAPFKNAGTFTFGSACRGMMVVVLVMGASVRCVSMNEKSRSESMEVVKGCVLLTCSKSSMTDRASFSPVAIVLHKDESVMIAYCYQQNAGYCIYVSTLLTELSRL